MHLRGSRLHWQTRLVLVSAVVVTLALLVSVTGLVPMILTTLVGLLGATGFVLGVSATTSAFFERDTYADSDFWR